jgi:hypothetical protein
MYRKQQWVSFWISFGLFSTCVMGSVVVGLVWGTRLALVGGTGACSAVGTYSYFALRDARRSFFTLALYHAYLAELRGTLTVISRLVSYQKRNASGAVSKHGQRFALA